MSNEIDLGIDLNEVVLDPLLQEQRSTVTCVKAEVKPNKAGTGNTLALTLKTDDPTKDTQDRAIPPGVLINFTMGITPSPKYTATQIGQKIKRIGACFGVEWGQKIEIDDLLSQTGTVVVTNEEDKEGKYEPKNVVKRFVSALKD